MLTFTIISLFINLNRLVYSGVKMYNPLHKERCYTMKELLLNVLAFVVTAGIIGILAHILGEKLPRA